MTQDTLVLIKPDAFRRRMAGQIITSVENLGLTIKTLIHKTLTEEEARELYAEHNGKWHFPRNIRHITSGPCVVIHVNGDDSVTRCRQMVETFRDSYKDVIRLPANLVHATSDFDRTNYELEAVGCLVVA